MKQFIFAITLALCTTVVQAENENAATSKEYVDTELATKQPTIPAEGANVVMTFDSTANDGIGTKQIYDETTSYVSQENTLVTAATANAAVQMAINGEFICTEYSTIDPTDCWLWGIKSEYYAKYDLMKELKNIRIFSSNYNVTVTFDQSTKISTVLIKSGSDDGEATFKLRAIGGSTAAVYTPEHKYYFRAKMRTTTNGVSVSVRRTTMQTKYLYPDTDWGIHHTIFEAPDFTPGNVSYYPVISMAYTGGGEGIQIDQNEFSVYDLTEIFGAGNEPATPDDAARELGLLYIQSNQ